MILKQCQGASRGVLLFSFVLSEKIKRIIFENDAL